MPNTILLAAAKKYIYAIDFSLIIEKMVKQDGWNKKAALEVCELYRNFLYLNKKHADTRILPPSEDMDEFWHYHILDTKKYVTDCQHIFGFYFHHYPYLVLDHQLNQDELHQAFSVTQQLHIEEFGQPIFAIRSRWSFFWWRLKKFFCL